jgi:hypothetical protein
MMPLNPEVGGTAGKGPGEIVARRASWRIVFCDGLIQSASGRATRLESSVLAPPRRESPRRPPAHPTQAWAMEGAAPDGNRGPNRGRPRRYAPLPPPAAAPGPLFPQSLGNRLPAPHHTRPPPPTLAGYRPSHSPGDEVIYTLGRQKKPSSTRRGVAPQGDHFNQPRASARRFAPTSGRHRRNSWSPSPESAACPSQWLIETRSTPAWRRWTAVLWRSVWGCTRFRPRPGATAWARRAYFRSR